MEKNSKKFLIILAVVLILTGLLVRFGSLSKDFSADEISLAKAAYSFTNGNGLYFYQSEQYPDEVGLWHPPMYVSLLSLVFNLGFNEINARLLSVIFSIMTCLVIFLICRELFKKDGIAIGVLSITLYMINFFSLSASIQIDTEPILVFFLVSFLYFAIKYDKTQSSSSAIFAVLALFLSLFTRLITPIAIFGVIWIYYLLTDRKKLWGYSKIGLVGTILFFAAWTAFSIISMPGTFWTIFEHTFRAGSEQMNNLSTYLVSFGITLIQFTRLMTFPAVILLGLALFNLKEKNLRMVKIYALTILLLFFLIPRPAFGFTRYFIPALPAFVILISAFIVQQIRAVNKKDWEIFAIIFPTTLLFLILLQPWTTVYSSNGLIMSSNIPDFIINLCASIPLLFWLVTKTKSKRMLTLMLIAILIGYSVYFEFSLLNNKDYQKEVGKYINSKTGENDLIIATKEIGFYADRKVYDNACSKPSIAFSISNLAEYAKKSLKNPEMDSEFFWPEGYYGGICNIEKTGLEKSEIKYAVLYHKIDNTAYEIRIGEFYIYRIN